jgi:hypothetical protein
MAELDGLELSELTIEDKFAYKNLIRGGSK